MTGFSPAIKFTAAARTFPGAGALLAVTAFLTLSVFQVKAQSATPAEEEKVSFERDVRPLLEDRCFQCHGEEVQKNKLRLDTVEGILRGGESGDPVFIAAGSAASQIIRRVTSADPHEVMPPKGARLTPEQVDLLKAWIDAGAEMPGKEAAEAGLEKEKLKTDHWSFQPVRRPAVPSGDDPFVQNGVDAFILEKLKKSSLQPSPPADPRTLIRRIYLVMHGLPPSPRETEEFLQDQGPDAYARLVERVLASPRYGERWARHWMDVARYADSNGFETNRERKTAWPYRDYLIESFNADKPYDRFIKEQLAGDALGEDAATGFLVAGAHDIVKSPDINLVLMQRQDELADMVNTTGTAFLGITMGCARCHNHKFDPVLQKDFFAMQAVFAGVNHGERPLRKKPDTAEAQELERLTKEAAAKEQALEALRQKAAAAARNTAGKPLRPAVNARLNAEEFPAVETAAVRFTIFKTNGGEACLDELEVYNEAGENVALASAGGKASASGSLTGLPLHRLEHVNDGLTGNAHSWISNTDAESHVQIDFAGSAKIRRIAWGRDREGKYADRLPVRYHIEAVAPGGAWIFLAGSEDREPFTGTQTPDAFLERLDSAEAAAARGLLRELAEVKRSIAVLSGGMNIWAGTFSKPETTHRLYRGDPLQPREPVAPGALTVLGDPGLSLDTPEQQRRLALGAWIASPDNPLTARVMVNRLWHYAFGTGLVDTPGDLGLNGGRPSHPELLDWLADEFVKSGWSVKHLQRLLLLSSTFRQSSAPRAEALAADADGRLLWRYTPRRIEGEAIRDGILAVSGALDLKMGGPGFYLVNVVEENVMHYFEKEKFTPADFRRMVYQARIRQTGDGVFNSFDCPDGSQIMARRSRSNTPLQALNLFNSAFVMQQADVLAGRLRAEAGEGAEAQTAHAFALFYTRPPDAFEFRECSAMIREQGLEAFCRALYNTSEFLFVF